MIFFMDVVQTVVIVLISERKLLCEIRSKEKRVYPGFLMCPGGHLEEGESLEECFKREVFEEFGVVAKKFSFLFSFSDEDSFSKKRFLHNFFLLEEFDGKLQRSRESLELQWLSYEEILQFKNVPEIHLKLVNELRKRSFL